MSALRIGIIAGAVIGAGLMAASLGLPRGDDMYWFLILLSGCVGSYLGCEAVIAVTHIRQSPVALLKTFGFLIVLSLLALAPYGVDAVRDHRFLAHADSAQGVVTRTYRGRHLRVTYSTGDVSRVVEDVGRDTHQLKVGDTTLVFWDPEAPTRATIGRPAPNWSSAFNSLIPICLIGGVLFLAFGTSATRATVPEAWRRPLQVLRAFLGAAAMADVGFWLAMFDWRQLANPRIQVSDGIWSALAFGAVFCFLFTVVLGSLGLLLLLERRWTSVAAFALCGTVFGTVGGLIGGLEGLFVGGVSGLFAALAFRWFYFRGSESSVTGFVDPGGSVH